MHITCPHCGFSREVPDEKIPPNTEIANCPKCKEKFRFRKVSAAVGQVPVEPPRPAQHFQEPDPPADPEPYSAPEPMPEEEAVESPARAISAEEPQKLKPIKVVLPEDDIWDKLESMSGPPKNNDSLSDEEMEERFLRMHSQPAKEADKEGIPFEKALRTGLFKGFMQTMQDILLRPVDFFSRMDPRGGYWKPIFFMYILFFILLLVQLALVQSGLVHLNTPGAVEGGSHALNLLQRSAILHLVLSPVIIPLVLFISSGVTHLLLIAFQASSQGFQATVRTTAYSSAPSLLNLIPLIGPAASFIWALVVLTIGLKTVHQSRLWKTAAVAAISFLIVFGGSTLIILHFSKGLSAP